MKKIQLILIILIFSLSVTAREFYVSKKGSDSNNGSFSHPFFTISKAVKIAMPGDVITIHEGTYREWVNPPRGGEHEDKRIVYRAAQGEIVKIKGSEVISNWESLGNGVWKVVIQNSFFGEFNPYKITMTGDWLNSDGYWNHLGEVYLSEKSLFETKTLEGVKNPVPHVKAVDKNAAKYTWYCESDDENTAIWANFHNADPNKEMVEINVRQCCFYPEKTGRNYITVDGFFMSQAATPWAPPTAEQIGLIGTNWSKGWIIENCTISNSKNSGITLGKDWESGHNGWIKSKIGGAEHYTRMVLAAKAHSGWEKGNIGHHIIRNNTIFDCEQTGICGSMGCIFSEVSDNHIYNIWTKRLFNGAEIAAIKFHAAVDVLIANNHLHHSGKGIWIDWMAQGTRITGNLCYENNDQDLFAEVNHGPFVVDNNIFLSGIRYWSEGGAFLHNMIACEFYRNNVYNRHTQYFKAHSTDIMGTTNILGGDDRFYNNIFIKTGEVTKHGSAVSGYGLEAYNHSDYAYQVFGNNNIYYNGAKPINSEKKFIECALHNPQKVEIAAKDKEIYLHINFDKSIEQIQSQLVTTEVLGTAIITRLPYQNYDGSLLKINTDYFGNKRNEANPTVGPF